MINLEGFRNVCKEINMLGYDFQNKLIKKAVIDYNMNSAPTICNGIEIISFNTYKLILLPHTNVKNTSIPGKINTVSTPVRGGLIDHIWAFKKVEPNNWYNIIGWTQLEEILSEDLHEVKPPKKNFFTVNL